MTMNGIINESSLSLYDFQHILKLIFSEALQVSIQFVDSFRNVVFWHISFLVRTDGFQPSKELFLNFTNIFTTEDAPEFLILIQAKNAVKIAYI